MKKLVTCLAATLALYALPLTAGATVKTYEFSFTAADLMHYETVNGANGSSAVDNSLFNGARYKRAGAGTGASSSFVGSQNAAFTSWASTTNDKLLSFNLWGLDGNGAHWGDDYKPTAWGTTSNPTGWYNWDSSWPASWGSLPAGNIVNQFIGWDVVESNTYNNYNSGFGFSDTNLADKKFTFQVDLDSTNAFWGGNTNGAPNTLTPDPTLTFWFGGWFDDDLWGTDKDWYMYEGNMVLTGKEVAPVPEPGTFALLGLGLAGLGAIARRRNKKA